MADEQIAPVDRDIEAARVNYDRRARHYETFEGRFERATRDEGLRLLGVRDGERVLEIGHGPGTALVALARAVGPEGSVTGLDLSPRMHDLAAARLAAEGLADRAELRVGSATALPFDDGCFDAVFMSYTLELFDVDDLDRVLGECHRVLRPGGRIGIVSLALVEPPSRANRIYLWFHRRFPVTVDCRPIPTRDLVATAGFTEEHALRRSLVGLPIDIVVARRP